MPGILDVPGLIKPAEKVECQCPPKDPVPPLVYEMFKALVALMAKDETILPPAAHFRSSYLEVSGVLRHLEDTPIKPSRSPYFSLYVDYTELCDHIAKRGLDGEEFIVLSRIVLRETT